jgi:hypothetical protein
MRRILVTITSVTAMLLTSASAVAAEQPASPLASCVAVITSYEGTQLPAGSVGSEVSGLTRVAPGLGSALVGPLAHNHLGSIERCFQAEG